MQTVEGIPSIKQFALVKGDQVGIDITPVESRTAEDDRDLNSTLVHQLKVVAHYQRRFHEQTAHPNRVAIRFFPSTENIVDRLLDAEIHDLVSVIGEDDIDEVLSNVVDVALHSREYEYALVRTFDPLHERLEESHRRLHCLG